MSVIKVLLWPLACLYNIAAKLRNYLYDIDHTPSFAFEAMVISVGNLNVGGSGKTPMIEYLVRLLKDDYRVAILSRGYGRKTKGFRLANGEDDASTLGDEPYQYVRKFGSQVMVAVGEERALAIPTLLNQQVEPQVILLDDAFQHRSVVPQFSILLTEASKPFYKDFVLPLGRLRESRSGAKRADMIIVTKCHQAVRVEQREIKQYAGEKPVFFTGLDYKDAQPFFGNEKIGNSVVLVSGIANSSLLVQYVSTRYQLIKHFNFSDHHLYTDSEIQSIEAMAQNGVSILTTEKDMVKLVAKKFSSKLQHSRWFYLPIETKFIENGAEFDKTVCVAIEKRLHQLKQKQVEG
jgi:tetraacyldisaccharide 4'-kinase